MRRGKTVRDVIAAVHPLRLSLRHAPVADEMAKDLAETLAPALWQSLLDRLATTRV